MRTKTTSVSGRSPQPSKISSLREIPRRREWRFKLPMSAVIQGELPLGKEFREVVKIKNISSTGAYFSLGARVVVGTKFALIIDLPKKATDGSKVQLKIDGHVVRLEKASPTSKKQGVAVRFVKDYKFVTSSSRTRS